MKDIGGLLDFIRFTHEIRNVRRSIIFENYERRENDEEHMYQLALLAWFIIENNKLKLDRHKVISLALVHDVSEAYSGDTNAHASEADRKAHEDREKESVKKLKKEWPTFASMHELIAEYKERKTPEAKFVYALDKLIPVLNIYLYEGRAWKNDKIDFNEMKRVKAGKIDLSPEINKYYQEFLKLVEGRQELFWQKQP